MEGSTFKEIISSLAGSLSIIQIPPSHRHLTWLTAHSKNDRKSDIWCHFIVLCIFHLSVIMSVFSTGRPYVFFSFLISENMYGVLQTKNYYYLPYFAERLLSSILFPEAWPISMAIIWCRPSDMQWTKLTTAPRISNSFQGLRWATRHMTYAPSQPAIWPPWICWPSRTTVQLWTAVLWPSSVLTAVPTLSHQPLLLVHFWSLRYGMITTAVTRFIIIRLSSK